MQEYYFLFGLAFVWIVFAAIQDLKKQEVPNWITYSLIIFSLAYRVFYSIFSGSFYFLFYGFIGFIVFVALAYLFYYGKVFAGGDAKLLMGLGCVIPFNSYLELFFNSLFFIFLLFFFGAIYSLSYSVVLVSKNFEDFKKEFGKRFKKRSAFFAGVVILCASFILVRVGLTGSTFVSLGFILTNVIYAMLLVLVLSIIYIYLRALEKACMIKLVEPARLTEGDWLEKDVKIGDKWIRKSVHGLSFEEINAIRKARKKVWVKYGVPFVPAFLFAFLFMLFFFLVLQLQIEDLAGLLF